MTSSLSPDPSVIGGAPEVPFVLVPDAAAVFTARARRFAFLAESGNLADYLRFLAALSEVQARLVADLPTDAGLDHADIARARAGQMPPIDRMKVAGDPALDATLTALCAAMSAVDMPEAARQALEAVTAAGPSDRAWLFLNLAEDRIPDDAAAPHLFAAAAWQVHLARLAGTLSAADLVPVGTGVCPACGGKPVSASITGNAPVENVRYCCCAHCATRWNEVRIKCLCCGSTKGISQRAVGTEEATVRAECCSECQSWVKLLYQVRNSSLDPVADDVASLGLDLLMRDSGFRRGGFHPFLAGL